MNIYYFTCFYTLVFNIISSSESERERERKRESRCSKFLQRPRELLSSLPRIASPVPVSWVEKVSPKVQATSFVAGMSMVPPPNPSKGVGRLALLPWAQGVGLLPGPLQGLPRHLRACLLLLLLLLLLPGRQSLVLLGRQSWLLVLLSRQS